MEIHAFWTAAEFHPERHRAWTVAVVDCLRATTSIVAALAAGATGVLPVAEEAEARAWAAQHGAILAGERECLPPPGFALGNSPTAFTPRLVRGREVVLWTTNGSRALARARQAAGPLLAFSLVNVGAVAAHLRQAATALAVVCAGTEGEFALEDAFAAGALIDQLGPNAPYALDERAQAARLLFLGGRASVESLLATTRAAARLRAAGLASDIAYAARLDVLDIVPLWREGAIRALPAQAGCGSNRAAPTPPGPTSAQGAL